MYQINDLNHDGHYQSIVINLAMTGALFAIARLTLPSVFFFFMLMFVCFILVFVVVFLSAFGRFRTKCVLSSILVFPNLKWSSFPNHKLILRFMNPDIPSPIMVYISFPY